ncbi:MAG: hypothetical protein ABW184_02255 [Sphingobium sp.]
MADIAHGTAMLQCCYKPEPSALAEVQGLSYFFGVPFITDMQP